MLPWGRRGDCPLHCCFLCYWILKYWRSFAQNLWLLMILLSVNLNCKIKMILNVTRGVFNTFFISPMQFCTYANPCTKNMTLTNLEKLSKNAISVLSYLGQFLCFYKSIHLFKSETVWKVTNRNSTQKVQRKQKWKVHISKV